VCEITAASESEGDADEEAVEGDEGGEDGEDEVWKTLKDSNAYEVSSLGFVKNASTGLVLKQFITNTGGTRVTLRIDGKSKSYDVHRLVAEVFLENPEEKPKVFHISDIRTDNRVKNLKWATNHEVALRNAENARQRRRRHRRRRQKSQWHMRMRYGKRVMISQAMKFPTMVQCVAQIMVSG
jgi:hypothetical protein